MALRRAKRGLGRAISVCPALPPPVKKKTCFRFIRRPVRRKAEIGETTFRRIVVRPMSRATATKATDREKQLQSLIEKFEPQLQTVICAARRKLRKRFPTATELAYDNYNFFVIGFGPNERPSDCIVTIAAAANGVGLCFVRGASLPDPDKVLQGSGKQTRFVRLSSAGVLNQRAFQAPLPPPSERHQC